MGRWRICKGIKSLVWKLVSERNNEACNRCVELSFWRIYKVRGFRGDDVKSCEQNQRRSTKGARDVSDNIYVDVKSSKSCRTR